MTKQKPNLLLLGDSIRMGYQENVKNKLEDIMNTFYPEENGRDTSTTLWQANQFFKNSGDVDIIYWNNGYWDMNIEYPMLEPFHPISDYFKMLIRMGNFFSAHSKLVIFANSLPIKSEGQTLDNSGTGGFITYKNEWVINYNYAAQAAMKFEKVHIDDLYTACLVDSNYFKSSDGLHLTAAGNDFLGEHIAKTIIEHYNSYKVKL